MRLPPRWAWYSLNLAIGPFGRRSFRHPSGKLSSMTSSKERRLQSKSMSSPDSNPPLLKRAEKEVLRRSSPVIERASQVTGFDPKRRLAFGGVVSATSARCNKRDAGLVVQIMSQPVWSLPSTSTDFTYQRLGSPIVEYMRLPQSLSGARTQRRHNRQGPCDEIGFAVASRYARPTRFTSHQCAVVGEPRVRRQNCRLYLAGHLRDRGVSFGERHRESPQCNFAGHSG